MLGASRGFAPWTSIRAPGLYPRLAGGLTALLDLQLEVAMTFGHCGSWLRRHGSYLLLQRELRQKRRKLPGILISFKRVTVTISPPCHRPLSSENLFAAILSQKKSIMQVLTANILMRISIITIICECFLP